MAVPFLSGLQEERLGCRGADSSKSVGIYPVTSQTCIIDLYSCYILLLCNTIPKEAEIESLMHTPIVLDV